MGLFKKNNILPKQTFDKADLLKKEKENLPMTYAEVEALQNEKKKDLANQILRVVGLLALMVIVVLSIGCFLYPYSLFNLFGDGDRFWNCWENIPFHLTSQSDINVFVAHTEDNGVDPILYYIADEFEGQVRIIGEGSVIDGYSRVDSIWVSIKALTTKAFWGTSAKANFIVLGAWSIIALSTVGLVAVIILAGYMIAFNIKDLILVIKHFISRTNYVITDISQNVATSIDSTIDGKRPATKEPASVKPKKPRAKKTEKVEPPTKAELTEEDAEDNAIAEKIASYKAEIAANEEAGVGVDVITEDKTPADMQNLGSLSDDELDRLLGK